MSNHIFRVEGIKTDDSGDLQLLKATGYAAEEMVGLHRVMPHGLASHAPAGSHGIGIAGRGERDLGLVLGLEHQDKRQKNLPEGTAVLYDDKGNVIRAYGQDGIQIEAKSGDVYAKPASGKNVYLGGKSGDGSTFKRVMLEDGSFSPNVWAKAS